MAAAGGTGAQQQRQAAAAAAAPPARVSGLVITAWIALWISISVSIIIVNKHVLYYTKFHFPFLLALCHMITGSLFARAAIWGLSIRDTVAEQNSFQLNSRLALVGVLFAVVLATGNAALLHLTVPTAQMLKAAGPATIYLVSIMLGTDVPRVVQAVQVLVVCTGVGIASHGDLTLTAAGLLLQLTSIFADSLRCCFLQKVMQSNHLQANALVTLAHVAPYSAFAMVVPVVLGEALTVVDTYSEWRSAIPLVCLSSMLAAVLNVVVFKVIGLTSALTTSLSGVLKEWATILVAMGIYGTPVSSMQWVGYSIALSGLTWYNVSRIARSRQQAEEAGKGGEVALQGAVAEKAALLGDASSSKAARDEEMGE